MAFPVVGVTVAVIFVVRALLADQGVAGRRLRSAGFVGVVRGLGLFSAFCCLVAGLYPTGLALLLLSWPPLWLSSVLLRAGALRAGAWCAFLMWPLLWRHRTRQLGLFCMSCSLVDRPTSWLAQHAKDRVSRLTGDLYGGAVAAGALVALGRDDLATARALFEAVAPMSGALAPRWVRGFAREFLVADAAQRGNWQEVQARVSSSPSTPTLRVFEHAANLLLAEVPRKLSWRTRLARLRCPNRAEASALWRWAATARQEGDERAALEAPTASVSDRSAPAKVLFALSGAPPGGLSAAALGDLAEGVQNILDAEGLAAPLTMRLQELGGQRGGAEVLDGLLVELRAQLQRHFDAAWAPAEAYAESAGEWLDGSHSTLMDELEQLRDAFCDRRTLARSVTGLAAWALWGKVCGLFEQVWAIDEQWRYGLFDELGMSLNNTAVDLLNDEKELTLAHQVFSFLCERRKYCLDEEVHGLVKRNIGVAVL